MMDKKSQAIGVFDSGVGGISVLRELRKLMPEENFIYYGDSNNAPYGTKDLTQVRALTIRNVEYLLELGAKGIVVACNTATSAAVAELRRKYPKLPLVGIEPAIKPAVLEKPSSRIIVMATPTTLGQEKFISLMAKYEKQADIVPLPCPGLMEFVERGDLNGEDLRRYLTELFQSVNQKPMDSIVLGCTHYPFAKNLIRQVAGEHVRIFDGGEGTAREMRRRLHELNLLQDNIEKGTVKFYNSRNTEEEFDLCERLLEAEE